MFLCYVVHVLNTGVSYRVINVRVRSIPTGAIHNFLLHVGRPSATIPSLPQRHESVCMYVRTVTDPQTHKHTHKHPQTGPITIHCATAS